MGRNEAKVLGAHCFMEMSGGLAGWANGVGSLLRVQFSRSIERVNEIFERWILGKLRAKMASDGLRGLRPKRRLRRTTWNIGAAKDLLLYWLREKTIVRNQETTSLTNPYARVRFIMKKMLYPGGVLIIVMIAVLFLGSIILIPQKSSSQPIPRSDWPGVLIGFTCIAVVSMLLFLVTSHLINSACTFPVGG